MCGCRSLDAAEEQDVEDSEVGAENEPAETTEGLIRTLKALYLGKSPSVHIQGAHAGIIRSYNVLFSFLHLKGY